MAQRKDIDITGGESAASPQATPEQTSFQASGVDSNKPVIDPGLPEVESPSISPANSEPVAIEQEAIKPKPEPEVQAAKPAPVFALVHMPQPAAEAGGEVPNDTAKPRFAFKPRHRRYARMAASIAIGAAFGAAVGAVMTGGFVSAPRVNVATLEENKSMRQSVAKLAKEVTALKSNLETVNSAATSQIAKIDEKLSERLQKESAEITGSISAPQTFASAEPAPAALEPAVPAPAAPLPRPAPRIAMAASRPSVRLPIVRDWSIRDARGGYVYVEGHGDVYQIVPGAPLPGLGPVQSIKRLEGRWVVTTPRGIIVSMRDRRYFE